MLKIKEYEGKFQANEQRMTALSQELEGLKGKGEGQVAETSFPAVAEKQQELQRKE